MNKKISLIHTPCKECVFAIYQENTQTGCKINYLQKYKEKNIEILEVFDKEKNFFVINNKKCLGYRDKKWLDKHRDAENISDIVAQENALKYIVLIPIESTCTIENIKRSVLSILNQKILPKGILFYKNRLEKHKLQNKELLDFMSSIKENIYWRIQNFIDDDMTDNSRLKAAISSCPINRFYLLVDTKTNLPSNCVGKIQNYIDNGNSFGCINIQGHKFFSYITVQYCENIKHINLLEDVSLHTQYETIG
jgi:hypothetical protein